MSRKMPDYRRVLAIILISCLALSAIDAIAVLFSFRYAVLRDKVRGAIEVNLLNQDFRGVSLKNVRFYRVDFRSGNFAKCDISNARFTFSRLESSNFEGADLSSATFDSVYLNDCDFSSANLSGAKLTYLWLYGADFTNCNLSGVDFEGSGYDSTTKWPPKFDPVKAGAVKTERIDYSDEPSDNDGEK